jgi:hypothetical protein
MTDYQGTCHDVGAAYVAGDGSKYQEHTVVTPWGERAWQYHRNWLAFPTGQPCGRNGCKLA